MTQKKKAIVALSSMIFTFVVAIVSVVSIFAISSVSIKTNVTISYSSNVVGGIYSFGYKNATDDDYTWLDENVSFSEIGETQSFTTGSITNEDVQLSGDNPHFIMIWRIRNVGDAGINFTLNYTDTGDADTGVTVYGRSGISDVYQSYAGGTGFNNINLGTGQYFSGKMYTQSAANANYQRKYCGTFAVKITLKDKYTNAIYDGDFSWTFESFTF